MVSCGTGFESFVGSTVARVPFRSRSTDFRSLLLFRICRALESLDISSFDVEGVRASVINDSSRIIYRPLIRGWIKASAIKLQNICAALSLYLPPSSTPPLQRKQSANGVFRVGGRIAEEKLSWKIRDIICVRDLIARFFLAAVSRGRSARWTAGGE